MLKTGIIGCGRIVELAHVPAFAELKRLFRIVALADPSRAQLKLVSGLLVKAGCPEPRLYSDYREMLKKEDLDACDLALPHFLHHRAVLDVAAAEVAVFTEKPLAVSVAQAKEMIATCRSARVPLVVFHNYLYMPQYAKAVELIKDGVIGKPFLVRSEGIWGGHWPGAKSYDPDWRTKSAKAGGGCLIDNAYHNLYLTRAFLQDDVRQVYASTATYNRLITVDDTAILIQRHKHGATSSIQVAWSVTAGGAVANEIHGTEGTISFTHQRNGKEAPIALFDNKTKKWSYPSLAGFTGNSFTALFREYGNKTPEWMANGRRGAAPTNAADALRNLQIIEAAYLSSKKGIAVNV